MCGLCWTNNSRAVGASSVSAQGSNRPLASISRASPKRVSGALCTMSTLGFISGCIRGCDPDFPLFASGFGASRLANELHLSVKTIETYQMHIKEKLGLRSAAELSEKATGWMLHSVRRNLQFKKQASFKNEHTSRLVVSV